MVMVATTLVHCLSLSLSLSLSLESQSPSKIEVDSAKQPEPFFVVPTEPNNKINGRTRSEKVH